LNVLKSDSRAIVYLEIQSNGASTFTVTDKNITKTYELSDGVYTIKLHSDCTVTFDGAAGVSYKEVIRDHEDLIPAEYVSDENRLHFNLWMTASFVFE